MLFVAAFAMFASPAGAQACTANSTYNPSATLSASPTTVVQGNSTTISGSGWQPNCALTLTIEGNGISQTINVVTDSTGSYSVSEPTSNLPLGSYVVTATQGLSMTTSFTVIGATVVTTVPGTLPITGSSSTIPFAQAGLALLCVGGLLVLVARKRRGEPVSTD